MTTSHTMLRPPPGRHRRLVALAAVGALGLALVACGDDDGDDTSTAQGSEDGGEGGGDTPTVEIVSPADGDTVGPDFDLELQSSEELGEPDTGRRHVHVYVDGDQDDYEIVYEDSLTLSRGLEEGEHTVEAQLADPDHSPVEGASDEVTVMVGDGGAGGTGGSGDDGGGSSTSTTSGDDDGGYGY